VNELSESLYLVVGKLLRKLRQSKDLTLVDLEQKSNIPFKTIQRYEVGSRKINKETLHLLLSLMYKDYDEFMQEVKMAHFAEEVKMYDHKFLSAYDAISYVLHQPKVIEYCGYEDSVEDDDWKDFVNDILDYIKFRSNKLTK
jgi:transcriptional regulator with XRE-family HTH domain